jgi:IS5 family transposase
MSPRMLLTLWLYAISTGIGSAREIERLTSCDDAFRWIVGDLQPSHDVIAAFRVNHGAAFDQLLTDVLAVLDHKGVLPLRVVAQDGTRVRASAGAPSFRSREALEDCREQAALHLKAVLADADNPELSAAARAAREAKAREHQKRIDDAIDTLKTLPLPKKEGVEQRASTTDKDARVMKMADGGFRPAFNIELAVAGRKTGGPRTIVGVRVTNLGTDIGSLIPVQDDIVRRVGRAPQAVLADANHFKIDDIKELDRRGILPVIPPPRARTSGARRRHGSDARFNRYRDWITGPAAKARYKERPALAEHANAVFKGRFGLDKILVRGLPKVTCVAMLASIAFNLGQNLRHLA